MLWTLLLLAAQPALASVATRQPVKELTEACVAATAPEYYAEFSYVLPRSFKDLVFGYRLSWKRFCTEKEKSDIRFEDLARGLDHVMKEFEKVALEIEGDESNEGFARFATLSCRRFPDFIPAFQCLQRAEGSNQYREPSQEFIGRIARQLGDAEDKSFFVEYRALIGDPRQRQTPWRQLQEADPAQAGCVKFASFDWVRAFQGIAKLKRTLKKDEYRAKVIRLEGDMLHDLEPASLSELCACGSKQEALATYRKLSDYFLKTDAQGLNARIKESIRKIEEGRVSFINDQEKHCGT